jgi:outer membrane receptor for ferrienterochelin and colicins
VKPRAERTETAAVTVLSALAAAAFASGPAEGLAGSTVGSLAQALLTQPETLLGGSLIGPPESRATWYFLGGIRPFDGAAMVVFSTGELGAEPMPGSDLGAAGEDDDIAGLQLSLRVPDDANSLRLAYRLLVPLDPETGEAAPGEDRARMLVQGDPLALDPWTSSDLLPDSLALGGATALEREGTPFSGATGAGTAWLEAVVPVVPGSQITVLLEVRDGGDAFGDSVLLLDGLRFDAGVPESVRPGRAPLLLAVDPDSIAPDRASTVLLLGRGLPEDLRVRLFRDGAPELDLPSADVRVLSPERVELDLPPLGEDLRGLELGWGDSTIRWDEALGVELPRPRIERLRPDVGPPEGGGLIALEGSGFVDVSSIWIGAAELATWQAQSGEIIEFVAPPGEPGLADVLVITAGGSFEAAEAYAYSGPRADEEGAGAAGEGGAGPLVGGCELGGARAGARARSLGPAAVLLLALLGMGWLAPRASVAAPDDGDGGGDDDDSAVGEEQEVEVEVEVEKSSTIMELPSIHERIVVTGTGGPRTLAETPVPTRVVDEAAIRETGAADVAQLLQRAPGVPVMAQGVEQRGGAAGISLQGVPAGRTLVLLDGRPVAGDSGGIVDLGQFPASLLERVEIVEGPMSALYGSEALGGVVHLVTRRPPAGTRAAFASQGTSSPSWDGSLSLSSAGRQGAFWSADLSGRLAAAQDLDRSDAATDLDRRRSLGVRLLLGRRGARSRVEGSAFLHHDGRFGTFLKENEAIDYVSTWDSPKLATRLLGGALVEGRPAPWLSLLARLDGSAWSSSAVEDLRDSEVHAARQSRAGGGMLLLRADIAAVPGLSAIAGLDGQLEGLAVWQDRLDPGGVAQRRVELESTVEWGLEPFVQGDLRLFSDRLELLPGLRVSAHPAFGATVTPSLSLRLRLWPGAALRASGARGYRAPSLKERYLLFDHSAFGYVVQGAENLRPESSWGVNLSLEQRLGNAGKRGVEGAIRIGAFAQRLIDLITWTYDPDASAEGLAVFRASNVAAARTLGAQLSAEYSQPWAAATLAYRLLGAFSDDGSFLPDSPVHALRGTLELRVIPADFTLSTAVGWESERFVDTGQTRKSPGIVLWDWRLEKRLPIRGAGDLRVHVGLQNLLDQRREPGRDGDFRPVEGRRILAGLSGTLESRPAQRSPAP